MEVEILNIAEVNLETKEQKLQFRKFKQDEKAVYEILCPEKSKYTAQQIIDAPDIPDRVKEIVEMTKERFYKYEIWEAESSTEKNPIILGRESTKNDKGETNSEWYDNHFFLGRWGDELENFNVLKERAIKTLIDPVKIELMKIKAKVDFYLNDVPLFMKDAIKKGRTDLPNFSEGCLTRF